MDNAGTPHLFNGSMPANKVLVKEYNVYLPAITGDGAADKISGLMGKTLTIKAQALTDDNSGNHPGDDGYSTTASSAIIQLVASNGSVDGKVENSTAASGTGVTYSVPNTYAGAKTLIAKIGIRVDGGSTTDGGQSDSADTICADFYVTVVSD